MMADVRVASKVVTNVNFHSLKGMNINSEINSKLEPINPPQKNY